MAKKLLALPYRLFYLNRHSRGIARWLLLTILFLAFGLRVYAIDASSLWSDEGNTWALVARSFSQIAADAAADIHPPGYYWLLKIWSFGVGSSAAALRLFSAFAGTLLVLFIFRIGKLIGGLVRLSHSASFVYGLLAALFAALSPFQIFYSQEARMYILLALAGAMLIFAFLQIINRDEGLDYQERIQQSWPFVTSTSPLPHISKHEKRQQRRALLPYGLYLVSGSIGLWTHYSFPILLLVVGGAFLIYLRWHKGYGIARSKRDQPLRSRVFVRFVIVNLLLILCYLPWIPTAIERVLNWPKGGSSVAFAVGVGLVLRTLQVGPFRNSLGQPLEVAWWWLLIGGALPIVSLIAPYLFRGRRRGLRRRPLVVATLTLWLTLPILIMLVFGLFTEAFLKFLLIAAPAWCLVIAALPMTAFSLPRRFRPDQTGYLWGLILGVGIIFFGWQMLPTYYGNSLARDNYAGVARYVDAVAASGDGLVLLNAPGQSEVWQYYQSISKSALPTLALPAERPINEQVTVDLMAEQLPEFDQIFALFWATNESDPNGVIEGWLDQHAFKSVDSWQGNLRFVRYDFPTNLACGALDSAATFGADIALMERCFAGASQAQVTAGEALLIGLRWRAQAQLDQRYKTTIQLLNDRNQVVAQRDSEPGGGSLPTDGWQPNTLIEDNYGIMVPFGTPPGSYRLIAALYHAETGERLPTGNGDHVELGAVDIVRPEQTIPLEIVPMDVRIDWSMGAVTLAGYDLYRKGFAHAPQTPISAGDLVHVTLYWQAPQSLPADWPNDLHFTMTLGDQNVIAPLVGGGYPTAMWTAGEFVRSEFDILYTGAADQIDLQIADKKIRLDSVTPSGATK